MIGVIVETDDGPVFQKRGKMGKEMECILAGYREATGLVGMGVIILPVIITGAWPFPGTVEQKQAKRCLVGLDDGSGNDGIYHSVMMFYPTLPSHGEEVVLSFIPAALFQQHTTGEMLNTGRLSACFDLAAWFVDGLPGQPSEGRYMLTGREVKALSLGAWANILITWLYGMDIVTCRVLQDMRLAICGIVVRRLASLGSGGSEDGPDPCPAPSFPSKTMVEDTMVEGYIKAYPGMMSRLADMLFCCSEAYIFRSVQSPETLCQEVVDRSLRFFQYGGFSD